MLKRLLFTISSFFLFFCATTFAADVGFIWDQNTETDLAGYRLYQSKASGVYVKGADKAVTTIPIEEDTATIQITKEGTYYWVITAYDTHGNESEFSNEVSESFDWTPPAVPKGLKINITVTITGE